MAFQGCAAAKCNDGNAMDLCNLYDFAQLFNRIWKDDGVRRFGGNPGPGVGVALPQAGVASQPVANEFA